MIERWYVIAAKGPLLSMIPFLFLPAAAGAISGICMRRWVVMSIIACASLFLSGCGLIGSSQTRTMTVTAYCGCGKCNSYSRGSWSCLKLDIWNRTVNAGSDKGRKYTGKTAAGKSLKTPNPGLLSADSLVHPWKIPVRTVLPWNAPPHDGTIAADTRYYPFGTRMFIPDWGWGIVTDTGGDIKGPDRLDIYMRSHSQTEQWGRKQLAVKILPP